MGINSPLGLCRLALLFVAGSSTCGIACLLQELAPSRFCKVVLLQEFTPWTFRSVPCRTTCSAASRTTGAARPSTFCSVLRRITCGTTFGARGTAAPSMFCSVFCNS